MLPPLSPVPDPRVTVGMPASCAAFTHADTCAVVVGSTTTLGRVRIAAVPSKPYGTTSSGFVSTADGPTMASSVGMSVSTVDIVTSYEQISHGDVEDVE
jgi:hypothetical protein